jgi:Holliday junction resolvasome RuvABC endonuclease subunit
MKRKNKSSIVILATDPASMFGWALSNELYGLWDMRTRKDESMGMKLIRLESKLNEIHEVHPLDLVVYERPAGQHKMAMVHQGKLIGTLEKWCQQNGIEYKGYSAGEIKKFATGKGNCGKPAMIKAAQDKYGYIGDDDNIADALHLLNMVKERLSL